MALGGIVTAVRTGFAKNGKPFGIITLEDFDGSGELPLFGENWGQYSGMFSIGASVYVVGKIRPRFQYNNDGPKELKVSRVEYLQTVKENAIDRITISLITDPELLNELISEHPGKTKLFFQLRDSLGKNHVLLRSPKRGVDVRYTLIDYIESHPNVMDYKIN